MVSAYLWCKSLSDGVIKGYISEEAKLIGGKSPKEICRILACDHTMFVATNPESGESRGMMKNGTFNAQVDIDKSLPLFCPLSKARPAKSKSI